MSAKTTLDLEDIIVIRNDLLKNKQKDSADYSRGYFDGVLDFFNKMKKETSDEPT